MLCEQLVESLLVCCWKPVAAFAFSPALFPFSAGMPIARPDTCTKPVSPFPETTQRKSLAGWSLLAGGYQKCAKALVCLAFEVVLRYPSSKRHAVFRSSLGLERPAHGTERHLKKQRWASRVSRCPSLPKIVPAQSTTVVARSPGTLAATKAVLHSIIFIKG